MNNVCSPTLTLGVKLILVTSIPGLYTVVLFSVVLFSVSLDPAITQLVKLPVLLVLKMIVKLADSPTFKILL